MLKNKEKLMGGIFILIVLVVLIIFLVALKNKMKNGINSQSTEAPVLEELTEQEGQGLDSPVFQLTDVPLLEEVGIEDKNLEQNQELPVSQPGEISPLEEL